MLHRCPAREPLEGLTADLVGLYERKIGFLGRLEAGQDRPDLHLIRREEKKDTYRYNRADAEPRREDGTDRDDEREKKNERSSTISKTGTAEQERRWCSNRSQMRKHFSTTQNRARARSSVCAPKECAQVENAKSAEETQLSIQAL